MTQPSNQSTNYLPWLIVGGLLLFAFKGKQPVQPVAPAAVVATVDPEIKAIADKAPADLSNKLAVFHAALADVLQRSEGLTNSEFRAWLGASDALYIRGTDLQGAFPGFTVARGKVYEKALGLEDVALDKAKAIEATRVIEASLRK